MRNIGGMQVGRGLRQYTTDQLTDLVGEYGPEGSVEADAIAAGTMVWDLDTSEVKVYNGTDFVALAFAA